MNNPVLQTILGQLSQEGLIAQENVTKITDALSKQEPLTPWYIQGLVAFSAWLAAMLFLLFLYGANIIRGAQASMVVGFIMIVAAVALRRSRKEIFATQFALAISIAGQWMAVIGVADRPDGATVPLLTIILLQAVLLAVYPDQLHRFLSTVAAAMAAAALCYELKASDFVHILLVALTAGTVWLTETETQWMVGKKSSLLRPIAYGLPVALLGMLLVFAVIRPLIPPSGWWPTSVLLGLMLFYTEARILTRYGIKPENPTAIAIWAGTALIVAAAYSSPGIVAAILILTLGFAHNDKWLLSLSFAFLLAFVVFYYYSLAISLLTKSGVLAGTGIVLLSLRLFLKSRSHTVGDTSGDTPKLADRVQQKPSLRYTLVLVFGFLVVLLVNKMIISSETLIKNGTTMIVELAPVDPRSLIQGDYMQLRYNLPFNLHREDVATDGYLVVTLDERSVVKFQRLYDGKDGKTPLAAQERLLRYRVRGWDVRVGANAFFFQEGHAQFYENARYGELRVTPSGDSILVGLRGQKLEKLGQR